MPELTARQTARIEELLSVMRLEEKVAQLTGVGIGALLDERQRVSPEKMARRIGRGIGQITLSAGATGLPPEKSAENADAIQRFLTEETRLGIPAIFNDECLAGFVCRDATCFPQAIGMGAAWSPELSGRMASVIARQARAVGSRLMYSPVFDVGVDPRWGRIEETWGEDPYLVSSIGVAFVKGLQSPSLREGVVSTAKHFAGYSASEGGRNRAPVQMGRRVLREIFLLPFEAAVKEGGLQSVMAAYHDIDGVPCAADPWLLTGLLREEWGFEGIVVADWGSVQMLRTTHFVARDDAEAGQKALRAGLDVETPGDECYRHLTEAVREGRFPEEIVDRAVRRHLRLKMLLGLFEDPRVPAGRVREAFGRSEDRRLALEAARRSMTLLKNEGGLLPIGPRVGSIAVIGPLADDPLGLLGDYSYPVYRRLDRSEVKIASLLEGIRREAPAGVRVTHVRGCGLMEGGTQGFPEAVRAAEAADLVVAVMGGRSALHEGGTAGENLDRAELGLPGMQEPLLRELHRTGKPIVLVLLNGRPLAVEWAAERIPAILEAWLPGEEGASAVAEVLFGKYNPGGKLPVSLLRTAGQAPSPYHARPSSSAEGAKYVFTRREPLYPFGHGLSYTEFAYSGLEVAPRRVREEEEVRVSCWVENTGGVAGEEVVQLYLRDETASVARPRKELKGFCRIRLEPGEGKRICFRLPVELLALWDAEMRQVAEAGTFRVMIGASSEDIRLEGRFELAEDRPVPVRRRFFTEVETG